MLRSLFLVSLAFAAFTAAYIQSPVDEANRLYTEKDYKAALPLYRQLAIDSPKVGRYRYRLGVCRLKEGELDKAAADFAQAKGLGVPAGNVDYNLACVRARQGKTADALKSLEAAVTGGFSDPNQLKSDEDLASLHPEPRFKKVLEKLEFPLKGLPGGDAMDHWVGEWTVTFNGQFAGENSIKRVHRGFGITEEWRQGGGEVHGQSLFAYDAGEKVWRHVWTNRDGWTVFRTGRPVKDGIYFEGVSAQPGQKNQKTREWITKRKDGTVRQLIEAQDGKTKKWTLIFDGIYTRKK